MSFISYRDRKAVYDNKKALKGKRLVITESLTQSRYSLLQKSVTAFGKNNVWSYDGRTWLSKDGKKHSILSEMDIAKY